MEWHSARGIGTMTRILVRAVQKVGREAGGTTSVTMQIWMACT